MYVNILRSTHRPCVGALQLHVKHGVSPDDLVCSLIGAWFELSPTLSTELMLWVEISVFAPCCVIIDSLPELNDWLGQLDYRWWSSRYYSVPPTRFSPFTERRTENQRYWIVIGLYSSEFTAYVSKLWLLNCVRKMTRCHFPCRMLLCKVRCWWMNIINPSNE